MQKMLYLVELKTDKTFCIREIRVEEERSKGYVILLGDRKQFLPCTKLFTEMKLEGSESLYFCVSRIQAENFVLSKLYQQQPAHYSKAIPSKSELEEGKVWLEMQKQRRRDHRHCFGEVV